MKKILFSILFAGLFVSAQAEEMWHIVGTNDYARKGCVEKMVVFTDSLTGFHYYFRNIPLKVEVSDLDSVYKMVFDRLVQTGASMPIGNSDIDGFDEGQSGFYRSMWTLNEYPTDEGFWIWNDMGVADLQGCQWSKNNAFIKGGYMRLLHNLYLQNTYLHVADSLDVYPSERVQVRFLRALTAWYMLDLFPYSHFTPRPDINIAETTTRQELYSWLESELTSLISLLPSTRGSVYEVDADAAKMLLARLYLNAEVYTGTAQWDKASQYAKQVMEGNHPLHSVSKTGIYSPYQELFMGDNNTNGAEEEALLLLKQDGLIAYSYAGAKFFIAMTRSNTGNMPSSCQSDPWMCWRGGYMLINAFISLPIPVPVWMSKYREGTEFTTPTLLGDDRAMFYMDENYPMPSLDNNYGSFTSTWTANKFTGRYSTDLIDGSTCSSQSNMWPDTDLPLMRSAEAWLSYAEAQYRMGNTVSALEAVNVLRARAHATPLEELSQDVLLDEWMREFYNEGRRRVDLVRFGQFASASATRTWEGHSGITDEAYNTFFVPELLAEFPRLDNKYRYFMRLVPRSSGEWDPDKGTICDSCNTGEEYYDNITNTSYSINYRHIGLGVVGAFQMAYPVESGDTVQVEIAEFPYMQAENVPESLPEVTPSEGSFVIMLYSEENYGSDLVVLGDYLNEQGEWIYSSRNKPQSHPTTGTTSNNQHFTRFESVGGGWYKAVVYSIAERDASGMCPLPGYANITGIANLPKGTEARPENLQGVNKAKGIVTYYTQYSTGEFSFSFGQVSYYEDPTYGRVYNCPVNTDRVVYLVQKVSKP